MRMKEILLTPLEDFIVIELRTFAVGGLVVTGKTFGCIAVR